VALEAVTVVVTSVAAGVVAWQSWETRRNANAANEALGLARIEEQHTRTLIAEGVKARIDANTPSVTLTVGKPTWPPVRTLGTPGSPPEELPVGTTFTMPRDTNLAIFVMQTVILTNRNDQPVQLRHNGSWLDAHNWTPFGETFTVPARTDVIGYYVVQRSLGEWVDIAEQRKNGQAGPEHRFELIYVDPADTGAIDHYEVFTGGIPIEPLSYQHGGWGIPELADGPYAGSDIMSSAVGVRRRQYWLSRTNNQRLD
jgi:hypothetical protein